MIKEDNGVRKRFCAFCGCVSYMSSMGWDYDDHWRERGEYMYTVFKELKYNKTVTYRINEIDYGEYTTRNNYEKYNEYFKKKQELNVFLTSNSNYIKEQIIELVKTNSGILQKDIYKYFEPEHKKAVIQILQSLLKEKEITRVKHGNTFELYLNN